MSYLPVSHSYCSAESGTTESRNCRNKTDPWKTGASRISASGFSRFRRWIGWMRTMGFLGSAASTETTLAVPTNDPAVILAAAESCWRRSGLQGVPIRLLGTRVASLTIGEERELRLF